MTKVYNVNITKYTTVHVLTVTLYDLFFIDDCSTECTILVSGSCKNLRTWLLSTPFSDFRSSKLRFFCCVVLLVLYWYRHICHRKWFTGSDVERAYCPYFIIWCVNFLICSRNFMMMLLTGPCRKKLCLFY